MTIPINIIAPIDARRTAHPAPQLELRCGEGADAGGARVPAATISRATGSSRFSWSDIEPQQASRWSCSSSAQLVAARRMLSEMIADPQ